MLAHVVTVCKQSIKTAWSNSSHDMKESADKCCYCARCAASWPVFIKLESEIEENIESSLCGSRRYLLQGIAIPSSSPGQCSPMQYLIKWFSKTCLQCNLYSRLHEVFCSLILYCKVRNRPDRCCCYGKRAASEAFIELISAPGCRTRQGQPMGHLRMRQPIWFQVSALSFP